MFCILTTAFQLPSHRFDTSILKVKHLVAENQKVVLRLFTYFLDLKCISSKEFADAWEIFVVSCSIKFSTVL